MAGDDPSASNSTAGRAATVTANEMMVALLSHQMLTSPPPSI
ncbi:hypothetical protein OK016_22070 [Vibrio chagasii]|nr:hypothetical protein [Vibrio chagasii]